MEDSVVIIDTYMNHAYLKSTSAKTSEYDQEMPESQITNQPLAL